MVDEIEVEKEAHVTTISFNRPAKRNALTQPMYRAMTETLQQAGADDDVRVLRFRGFGRNFTAGNDLADFQAADAGNDADPASRQFLHAVVDFPKPLVAQVSGHAVGIGTTLLLHCDFVVAATDTRFALPFVKLGVVPEFASSVLLPELVGRHHAARLLLLGEEFNATQAQAMGLLTELRTPESLAAATWRLCQQIAAMPPGAVQSTRGLLLTDATRQRLHEAIDREWAVFAERLRSPEHKAAVEAFFSKRK